MNSRHGGFSEWITDLVNSGKPVARQLQQSVAVAAATQLQPVRGCFYACVWVSVWEALLLDFKVIHNSPPPLLSLSLSLSLLLAFNAGLKVAVWNQHTAFTPCTAPLDASKQSNTYYYRVNKVLVLFSLCHWHCPALQNLSELMCTENPYVMLLVICWTCDMPKTEKQVVNEQPSVLSSWTVCLSIDCLGCGELFNCLSCVFLTVRQNDKNSNKSQQVSFECGIKEHKLNQK